MLPHNRLGRELIRKLHVVPGAEHPHGAQKPEAYTLGKPPLWEGIPAPKPKPARNPKKAPASKVDATGETVAPAAKKTTAKKPTTKKTTAKKPTSAKKTAARKPAAKKES
jgi:ribosomal protein L13